MRQLERNKRPVAVAHRSSVDGVETYAMPITHLVNHRFTRGEASMEGLGEFVAGGVVVFTSEKIAQDFHEFDKVYVFVTPPAVTDANATDADYIVEAVMPGMNGVRINLKRVNV